MKELSIDRIPAALLLEVTEIATVYSAKLAKNKDLVMLTSTSGATKNMTKAEFIAQKFCNINGKEVRLISMKAGTEYMVYHIVNKHSFAVKVPRGNKTIIHLANNTNLTSGKVLVIGDDKITRNEDGTFDMSVGHVMSEAIFRKTCILRSVSNELLAQIQNRPVEEATPTTSTNDIPYVKHDAQHAQIENVNTTPSAVQAAQKPQKPTAQQPNKGKIIALGKNRRGQVVSYFVAFSNNDVYQLTEANLMTFCERDLIENATVVHSGSTRFLRGVGISLTNDLPSRLVDEQ